jgi:hypothetical protein
MQNLVHFHNVSGDACITPGCGIFPDPKAGYCSGQQISWLAARAIQHKFLKLYFPELPDKPDAQ